MRECRECLDYSTACPVCGGRSGFDFGADGYWPGDGGYYLGRDKEPLSPNYKKPSARYGIPLPEEITIAGTVYVKKTAPEEITIEGTVYVKKTTPEEITIEGHVYARKETAQIIGTGGDPYGAWA